MTDESRRRGRPGAAGSEAGDAGETEEPRSSEVVEYRDYEEGVLQAEKRIYQRKDGSRGVRGPYWYFKWREDGRRKTIYLGKTDEPERVLESKRGKM